MANAKRWQANKKLSVVKTIHLTCDRTRNPLLTRRVMIRGTNVPDQSECSAQEPQIGVRPANGRTYSWLIH